MTLLPERWLEAPDPSSPELAELVAHIQRNFEAIERAHQPVLCIVARRAAALSVANATATQIALDTLDQGVPTALSGGDLVIPAPGRWLLVAHLSWEPNATGARLVEIVQTATTATYADDTRMAVSTAGVGTNHQATATAYLPRGAAISLMGRQWSGGSLAIGTAARTPLLTAVRLSL